MLDFQCNWTFRPLNRVRLSWLVIAFLASFGTAAAKLRPEDCLCDRLAFPPTNNPSGRVLGGEVVNETSNGILELASTAVIYTTRKEQKDNKERTRLKVQCTGTSINRTEFPFTRIFEHRNSMILLINKLYLRI